MVKRRRVAILGSTGSIGTQALEVIAKHPDRFEVAGLAAGKRIELLLDQARRFRPARISCSSPESASELRAALPQVEIGSGARGLLEVATESRADVVLAATDGAVAFDAVFAAAERGIALAVANKELVVAAGELLFAIAAKSGAPVLPVDSEHSALFQCLVGERRERIAMLVLTASGGPFWEMSIEEMARSTVADALQHPTWNMGTKNTVDSATMMNKGLEVIEASRFFGLPAERIAVLVHRTSVAHGFAVFTDGNVKGQFAPPDMRLPIGYALAYPDRLDGEAPADPLAALGGGPADPLLTLAFERPDRVRFPCLDLAYRALHRGGTAPAALSAANEIAVTGFVAGRIGFGQIAGVVGQVLEAAFEEPLTLENVRAADRRARELAEHALAAAERNEAAFGLETNSSASVV